MSRTWNNRPAVKPTSGKSSLANRQALKKMSDCQVWTGLTADELRAVQQRMKQQMLAKKRAA